MSSVIGGVIGGVIRSFRVWRLWPVPTFVTPAK